LIDETRRQWRTALGQVPRVQGLTPTLYGQPLKSGPVFTAVKKSPMR
jgi:hypothetical protein